MTLPLISFVTVGECVAQYGPNAGSMPPTTYYKFCILLLSYLKCKSRVSAVNPHKHMLPFD